MKTAVSFSTIISITPVDAPRPVTTFCLLFEPGFDAYRLQTTPPEALLDSPRPARMAAVEFFNRLEPLDNPVMRSMQHFRNGTVHE
jgi:hypothetical protein